MSVRLSCSGCGGTVSADDAALRRRLAVCSRCNTIVRVAGEDLTSDRDSALHPQAPRGVVVDRRGERDLSICAERPRGAWAFNELTRAAGWTAGLVSALVCWTVFGWTAIGLGLPLGLAAFVTTARMQRRHRPVELRGGLLLPSDPAQKALAVADLQQVYPAVSHMDLGGDSASSTPNVFALTERGDRVLLVGPVASEQVAAYIGRVLESEMQLFDRDPGLDSTNWASFRVAAQHVTRGETERSEATLTSPSSSGVLAKPA